MLGDLGAGPGFVFLVLSGSDDPCDKVAFIHWPGDGVTVAFLLSLSLSLSLFWASPFIILALPLLSFSCFSALNFVMEEFLDLLDG